MIIVDSIVTVIWQVISHTGRSVIIAKVALYLTVLNRLIIIALHIIYALIHILRDRVIHLPVHILIWLNSCIADLRLIIVDSAAANIWQVIGSTRRSVIVADTALTLLILHRLIVIRICRSCALNICIIAGKNISRNATNARLCALSVRVLVIISSAKIILALRRRVTVYPSLLLRGLTLLHTHALLRWLALLHHAHAGTNLIVIVLIAHRLLLLLCNIALIIRHIGIHIRFVAFAAIVVIAAVVVIAAAEGSASAHRRQVIVVVITVVIIVIIVIIAAIETKCILHCFTCIIRHFGIIVAVIAKCIVHIRQVAVITASRVQATHRYLRRFKIFKRFSTIRMCLVVIILLLLLILLALFRRTEDTVIHKVLCRAESVFYPLTCVRNRTCNRSERKCRNSAGSLGDCEARLNRSKSRRSNCTLELALCGSCCLPDSTALDSTRHIARKE